MSAANIVKKHWQDDSGMRKIEHKTSQHENYKKPNKNEEKREK